MLENFESYLLKEKRNSVHTVSAYLNDVQTFLTFSNIKSTSEFDELNYNIVRAWMVALIEAGTSNRSVNRKLSALRTFFKWAKRNRLIQEDPMLRIKGPKQGKRLPEFVKSEALETQKIEALFNDSFSGKRDRIMFELFYQTGMRLSELIGLKHQDFFDDSLKVIGKRNKERIIPISKDLAELLFDFLKQKRELHPDCNYILCTDKGEKLYPKFVYRKINNYLSSITSLKKKSPHVLRHTFATHMLNNGAGLEALKEILGHANLSATQVYTHHSFAEVSKIYKQAHPRGEA